MKRIVVSLLVSALVPALAWIGGFDFDERGFIALFVCLYAIGAFVFTYAWPGWDH